MKCKTRGCSSEFIQHNTLQNKCFECMANIARKSREKDTRERRKRDRAEHRADKERIKTKPKLIKEAQDSVNKVVHIRDARKPCVSCGRYDHEIDEHIRGGKFDAGHYLSVGSCTELRFELDNIHKQCKSCNGGAGRFSKKEHTVTKEYRVNLIDRIGLERVEWLEGPHEMPNWTHDDLRKIRDEHRAMANRMRAESGE